MKNKKQLIIIRIVIAIVAIVVLIAGGRRLIQQKKIALSKSPKFKLDDKLVKTAIATKGDLKEAHDYLATVEPFQTADVSAQVTAVVTKRFFQEGDSVKKGDLLAVLDDSRVHDNLAIVKSQIAQLHAEEGVNKATLKSLKKTTDYWKNEAARDKELAEKGTIPMSQAQSSEEKYNEVLGRLNAVAQNTLVIKQQIEANKSKLDEVKTSLSYYQLTSPFDGVISARRVSIGDLAVPGKALFTIEDHSEAKLIFDVPQGDLSMIQKGAPLTFKFRGKTHHTQISRIYPKLNRARMLRTEANLSTETSAVVPLGAYVSLSAQFTTHKDAVLIPLSAIFEVNGKKLVYLVVNGKLSSKEITLLGNFNETAAVSGIEVGAEVVTSSFLGWARLANGMSVESKK